MNNFYKKIASLLILIAVFGGGYVTGQTRNADADQMALISGITNKSGGQVSSTDFSTFWKVWAVLNKKYVATKVASTTASSTSSNSPSTAPVSDQDRIYGAIKGMVSALGDPYTVFFPPNEAALFKTEIDGNFEGVGMEVGQKDGILTVIAPISGSPAERAGIKAGDKIIKIDETVTNDMSIDQAVKMIRGKKGTVITILIFREGASKPIEFKLTRDVITIPTIENKYNAQNGIYTIKLYSFNANSSQLFQTAIRDFITTGSNKLVIDLRGNPGGFLDSAVSIASNFLPAGAIIVRESYGENQPEDIIRSAGLDTFKNRTLPKTVILIDGGSASASEILAGALREQGVAKLVGTKSFGKGSVQELVNITDDTALKVTIARWLTPLGHSISEVGVAPDVEVKLTEDDVKNKNDAQMKKAEQILLGY